jgi:hypothetical protein
MTGFDKLPPEHRPLILVASDDEYRQLTARLNSAKTLALLSVLPTSLTPASLTPFAPLLQNSFIEPALAHCGVNDLHELCSCLRRAKVPFPRLSPAQASARFAFANGHPQDGMAYLRDPARPNRYLVPALANERLAQEKVAAFHDLASALGAQKLALLSGATVGENDQTASGPPLRRAAGQLGIHAQFDPTGNLEQQSYREFGRPPRGPYVPDHVRPWLATDPLLESLATSRINGNVLKSQVSLIVNDPIDIGEQTIEAIRSLHVAAGGRYQPVVHSVWSFAIEFWPKEPVFI